MRREDELSSFLFYAANLKDHFIWRVRARQVHPCLIKQPKQILVRTVALCDRRVVANIVSGVLEGRVVNRIQPYSVASKTLDIVQLLYDTGNIAYTVIV